MADGAEKGVEAMSVEVPTSLLQKDRFVRLLSTRPWQGLEGKLPTSSCPIR
jgi:hypothetical protein